jgi:Skp family chaperone for outer membrane proteins
MRLGSFAVLLVLALSAPASVVFAQEKQAPSAVLTIDPERLFADSQFGKAALARLEAEQAALLTENKKLEAALEAEEKDLTLQRPTLPAAEFRVLADAFDSKAEEIRAARLAKSRSLTSKRDEDRQKFLSAVVPILGNLMGEMGGLVILDKKTVFLSFDRVDVTDVAIARIDSQLDSDLQPKPPVTPVPEPVPAP